METKLHKVFGTIIIIIVGAILVIMTIATDNAREGVQPEKEETVRESKYDKMNKQAEEANNQLAMLSFGLEEGTMTGAQIYSNFTSTKNKIAEEANVEEGTRTFVIYNDSEDSEPTLVVTSKTKLNEIKDIVNPANIYKLEEEYHPTGDVSSQKYIKVR